MKFIIIILGIFTLGLGLFLTFGILVYSLKERDYYGLTGLFLALGLAGLGIYCIVKGIKYKASNT